MGSSHFFFDGSYSRNMLLLGSGEPVFLGSRSLFSMEENSKRRPFFTSPEELVDEEYYDEQLPEKKRRLTPDQVNLLEKSFEVENKLEPERKSQLAKKLGLQPRQVAVWFQNRRARWKTKQLERDYDLLKASYDTLLSDYDSIVKDNQKLKSEVVSLTEKLVTKEVGGIVVVGQKSDPLIKADKADDILKAEDHLSSGSGASAVVDEDGGGPHPVDSGDSYFLENDYGGCMGPIDGIQSEEDDRSDDNRNYISEVFVATEHHQNEEGESLGWWVWS